jgi:hypothetical protein
MLDGPLVAEGRRSIRTREVPSPEFAWGPQVIAQAAGQCGDVVERKA